MRKHPKALKGRKGVRSQIYVRGEAGTRTPRSPLKLYEKMGPIGRTSHAVAASGKDLDMQNSRLP